MKYRKKPSPNLAPANAVSSDTFAEISSIGLVWVVFIHAAIID